MANLTGHRPGYGLARRARPERAGGEMARPEIGPAGPGRELGLLPAPRADARMMARQQHLRHRVAFPDLGPGVVGVLEQTAGEALLGERGRRAEHPGQQADAGVEQGERRGLAAGQHEIAEAHLLERPGLDDPLVDPLEAPA